MLKDFFHSAKFKILIGVLIVFAGFMLYDVTVGGKASITSNIISSIVGPIQKASAKISQAAVGFLSDVVNVQNISKENEQLRAKIDQLNEQMVDYEEMKRENELYKQFLQLKEDNPDFQFEPAFVIGRDPTSRFAGFTIDKGSHAGVEVSDPVITSSGLVGVVTEVGYNFAQVSTILSASVEVGVIDVSTRDTGIVSGTLELSGAGLCKMSYIARDAQITPGNLIITAGSGGVYPEGLIIGEVIEVKPESHGMSLYATIRPASDIDEVKDVLVIKDFEGQGLNIE